MYAPLAPIVVICGTIYFWTASITVSPFSASPPAVTDTQYYYELKYVEDTRETDGKVWTLVINRLLVGTAFMQLLLILSMWRSGILHPITLTDEMFSHCIEDKILSYDTLRCGTSCIHRFTWMACQELPINFGYHCSTRRRKSKSDKRIGTCFRAHFTVQRLATTMARFARAKSGL